MSRAILCLVTLGVAALAGAQTQPPARDTSAVRTESAGSAIIRGRVMEAGTNRPLAHALVRVTTSQPGFEKLAPTDSGGRFEVSDLARGTYTIGANKTNYLPQNRGEKRPIGPGIPIQLADGQVVENVNFSLLHAGAVTGRVTDEFGEPLADTQVSLMRWFFTNGERRLQPSGGSAMTNDLGEFRVFNVRPGQYIVGATLRMGVPGGDSTDRTAYTQTFYPGTPNPNEAQKVTIAPGQTVPGMSFGLLPVTSARVSGMVVNSKGQPLANGSINAMTRTNGFGSGGGGGIRDGKFSLTLTPGDYTLRVMMPGGPLESETALLDVSVASTDISDLMLVMASPATLRGRFVFEPGDVKLPERSIVRVSATAMSSVPGGATATAKDDMTFEMKIVPGRVMLRAPASNEWRLRRITLNGADVTDTGLQVPGGATIDGLVVQLTTHLGRLSIRVVDEAGEATRDCQVVVFARDPAQWTPMTRFVSSGRPNLDGLFEPRLPAGDYLVAAFADDSPSGLWNDPDVLAQLRESAVAVSITDDREKKVDVKVGAAPIY